MACLRRKKKKNGFVYEVDFTFKGRRLIRSTRTDDLSIAKKVLHDIQGKIALNTFRLEDYKQKRIRLSEFFKEYFEYAQSAKSEHTITNERNYTDKLIEFLGDIDVNEIDARLLDKWRAHILTTVSPATFNLERRTLASIFSVAVKWKYLSENPFKGVQREKLQEHRLYLKSEELTDIFKVMDQESELLHVHKHRDFARRFRLLIEFLLNTGLRREEALRLTPSHVDLVRNLIHVEQTKSKQMRVIPLNRRAREIILLLDESLFSRLNKNHVSRKFAHFVQEAGLTGFKLHSLRHTFATNLYSAGVDIYTISRLLGHADIRTSLIYTKAKVEVLRSAVLKLDAVTENCNVLVGIDDAHRATG